ncbi:MAG: hypothetical protein ACREP1_06580, partial [Rhodanobacteraceae bacterium]
MEDLSQYAERFEGTFPRYGDDQYKHIARLVKRYASKNIERTIDSVDFKKHVNLLEPLIAIKNYKSQIPFPETLAEIQKAVALVPAIRRTSVTSGDISQRHGELFKQLLDVKGFQLPTASAVFHFCH